MTPRVLSVNVGRAEPSTAKSVGFTGIDKRPVDALEVRDPGSKADGLGSGVVGDFIGDRRHHGGSNQAAYLVASAELAHWGAVLDRDLRCGSFGENITTAAIDVDGLPIGTTLSIGGSVLVTRGPRIPCGTFAAHMAERGWTKRFVERGRSGVYCAVLTPGTIRRGDPIEVDAPAHGIDTTTAFRAFMGDLEAAERVLAAEVLVYEEAEELAAKVSARSSRA